MHTAADPDTASWMDTVVSVVDQLKLCAQQGSPRLKGAEPGALQLWGRSAVTGVRCIDLLALLPALAVAYGFVLGGAVLVTGWRELCEGGSRRHKRTVVPLAGIAGPEAGSWVR